MRKQVAKKNKKIAKKSKINVDLTPIFFKALCDPNRIFILKWLNKKATPITVNDVAKCCHVDLSVVSRHLATMKVAGILKSEKRGKEVLYSVNTDKVTQTLRSIADYLEICSPTIQTLAKPNAKVV